MNKKIKKKFLNLKIDLISQKKTNKITIITNRNSLDPVLRVIWCASIFNNFKNNNIVLFTSKNFSFFNKIFSNFGIKKFEYIKTLEIIFKNFLKSTYYLIISIFYYLYYSCIGIDHFIKSFNVNRIKIGQNIHETYLKKYKFYNSNKKYLPIFYFKYILSSYILINYIENFFLTNTVENLIINKKEYFAIDALLFLIAKKYKVRTIILSHEKILLKKNISFNEAFYTLKKKDLKKKINKKKIDKFINLKFKGLIDIDYQNAFSKKKILNTKILNSLIDKKRKKIILFCPHAFSDSLSANGEFLFRDFYEFYEKSIDEMCKIKDTTWLVKLHPTRFMYGENGIGEKYLRNKKHENIILIPDQFSTSSIVKIVDGVVTARGSIIPEAAFLGKKTLAYQNTRFKNSNIYVKYYNKEDYYKKLRFKNINLKISKSNKKLAKKLMYIIHEKIFLSSDSLLLDQRGKNNKQLDIINYKIYKKLKKGKQEIQKSQYYKKLYNKFV